MSRSRLAVVLLLTLAFLVPSLEAGTYLRVQSWNGRHMGWSGETDWAGYAAQVWNAFGSTSSSAAGLDVVALQEVMYDTSVTSLVSALEAKSGYDWSGVSTAALGRSSYKERYAVLWRTDRATLVSNTTWNDVGDKFEREPQIVRLRVTATGADVTLVNWHTVFGTTAERQAEIQAIDDVFKSIQSSTTSDQDVILLGDHNRSATDAWWSQLKGLSPAVTYKVNDLTSINSSCAFASAYDHFWFQSTYVTEYSSSGRDYVADMCALYNGLSDHAPIWIKLYSSGDDD